MLEIEIQDPSGHFRRFRPGLECFLSNDENAPIPLRDASLGTTRVQVRSLNDGLTLEITEGKESFRLGDLGFRSIEWREGIPITLGETILRLTKSKRFLDLPRFPSSKMTWETCTNEGRAVIQKVSRSARTTLPVYLRGETGTGKEILANLVHAWSPSSSGRFVPLHCGALAPGLIESELFGHTKGAFTGAHQTRTGALLQAHGGTLFLDEVGELSQETQVKLLRFLEDGEIRPVGSDRVHYSKVRLVCATHRDLIDLVKQGRFRQDLYYRIASIRIQIPSLRNRRDDIVHLARHFSRPFAKSLSPAAIEYLQSWNWPGNVRELRHAIERSCGLGTDTKTVLVQEDFEFLEEERQDFEPEFSGEEDSGLLKLKDMERKMLIKAIRIARGNRRDAARLLGVARSTVFEMLKRRGIKGPRSDEIRDPLLNGANRLAVG